MHGNVRHMRHHHVPHYEAVPGWLGNLSPSSVNNQQVKRIFIWVCCDNRVREQPRGRKRPLIRHAMAHRTTAWLIRTPAFSLIDCCFDEKRF